MKNVKKILITCSILILAFSNTVFAYATLPAINSSKGFNSGSSLQVPTRYWQYGGKDWSSAIEAARQQFSASPALVSLNVSSNHSYDSAKIRVSSNYWTDFDWTGLTSQFPDRTLPKTVELNSSAAVRYESQGFTSWNLNKTATHELGHAFGFDDCESGSYVMCGYWNKSNTNQITTYENNLLINRYGN